MTVTIFWKLHIINTRGLEPRLRYIFQKVVNVTFENAYIFKSDIYNFYFHVNDRSNPACQFLNLLDRFNLNTMNVNIPTHKSDNVLDLIITRLDKTTTSNLSIDDPAISDPFVVHCNLTIERPPNPNWQILKSRKLCNVNLHKLRQDIDSSTLVKSPSSDIKELCDQ